jgi:hypothetical protein
LPAFILEKTICITNDALATNIGRAHRCFFCMTLVVGPSRKREPVVSIW